jgi:hypothetical protein
MADDSNAAQADKDVGISFVDILFALVVGQALMALNRVGAIPAAGRSHLIFASVLTITSWIGYHRSAHRYAGDIGFDIFDAVQRVALAKLLLDIILVVLYWVAVQTTEWGFSGVHQSPSWGWSTGIATASFCIYVLWDYLSWITPSDRPRSPWCSPRRLATVFAAICSILILIISASLDPRTNIGVTIINSVLTLLAVGYRILKDTWGSAAQKSGKGHSRAVNPQTPGQ